jgi:CspA family cold shock protein
VGREYTEIAKCTTIEMNPAWSTADVRFHVERIVEAGCDYVIFDIPRLAYVHEPLYRFASDLIPQFAQSLFRTPGTPRKTAAAAQGRGPAPGMMAAVSASAVVREWHDDEGWGVVDSPEVPGGCWVGFAHVMVAGYRSLRPGQPVALEWEPARQDGFDYRAIRVWPSNADPAEPPPTPPGDAYTSTLTLTFDPMPPSKEAPDH